MSEDQPRNRGRSMVESARLALTLIALLLVVSPSLVTAADPPATNAPFEIALIAPSGDRAIDREIIRWQTEVARESAPVAALSRLGFSFVQKGKETHDPGQFTLARVCAEEIERRDAGNLDGLLLTAHVLQNLHEFAASEKIARRLVSARGSALDHGVLGDACLEQGKLDAATTAYQAMADRRPGPAAYNRIAHLRWLRGDAQGAAELFARALRSMSAQDTLGLSYTRTQLARAVVGLGHPEIAKKLLDHELSARSKSGPKTATQADSNPAALLLAGLIEFEGDREGAAEKLRAAALSCSLPEFLWGASDAARAVGDLAGAKVWDERLLARGAIDDPRTTALFLATRGIDVDRAIELAKAELETRKDVHSYDALAWALFASGDVAGAREPMSLALREGTPDPRILLHGAAIAHAAGIESEAQALSARAHSQATLLFPSERALLESLIETLDRDAAPPRTRGGSATKAERP